MFTEKFICFSIAMQKWINVFKMEESVRMGFHPLDERVYLVADQLKQRATAQI